MSLNNPSELHHLTLNSSGGIALGAFMAGVSFEIVKEALEEKYFAIDIITGASAGAMTGAIATYYLLQNNKHAFERPEGNALYQAWVEKADMQNIDSIKVMPIEEFAVFEKKPLSVLASKAIEEITKLIDKPPETIQRPIALLMTVTNLQGLLLKSDSNKKLISSAETREFFFYPGLERQDRENFTSMWNKVKAGSLASGAFPVAFSPIKDISNIESRNLDDLSEKDYFQNGDKKQGIKQELPIAEDSQHLGFLYSDGGILDNLPILKGIKLESKITHNDTQSDRDKDLQTFKEALLKYYPELKKPATTNRLHVYIQPNPAQNLYSANRLLKTNFTLVEVLLSSFLIPNEEHTVTQLQQVLEIKRQASLKKDLLTDLPDDEAKKQLEEIVPFKSINLNSITPLTIKEIVNNDSNAQERLKRLEPIYQALIEYENIKDGLEQEDPSKLLVSDFINAFGGFFDRKYREHDFLLGRICGLTWLYLNFEIEPSQQATDHIEQLVKEIKHGKKILDRNPSISDLKLSYRIRLFRIFVRFLRIVTLESNPALSSSKNQEKKFGERWFWIIFYLLWGIPAILVLRILETLLTVLLVILLRFKL